MPQLIDVQTTTRDGKEGFNHTYEIVGVSEFTAEDKALAAAASRYPLKVIDMGVVDANIVEKVGRNSMGPGLIGEWTVTVFVPKEGLKENMVVEKARELVGRF